MADIAKNTVKFMGRYYTPGQEVPRLSKEARAELLAADAIAIAEEPKAPRGKKGESEKEPEKGEEK